VTGFDRDQVDWISMPVRLPMPLSNGDAKNSSADENLALAA